MAEVSQSSSSGSRIDGQHLRDAVRHAGEGVDQIKGDLTGLGREVAASARGGASALRDNVSLGYENAKLRGEEAVEAASAQIVARPLTSVAIALGVGVLIGIFIRRPRS